MIKNLVISWSGLPQYAARLIKGFIDYSSLNVNIIGTRPKIPVRGMEEILNNKVFWVEENSQDITWAKLGISIPDVFIQSGWATPSFKKLAKEVKSNGGIIIGLSDNAQEYSFRQLIMSFHFRIFKANKFDGMIVPGISGINLMRFYGMPLDRLRPGLYGADKSLFRKGLPLATRPKEILFVGQLIPRKGLLPLCNAFIKFSKIYPDWSLRVCGNGVLRTRIPASSRIIVEDFIQPDGIANLLISTRFLILPSLRENWGLVVHEATCCGCALLLSINVGSAKDLARNTNSILFSNSRERTILKALIEAANWTTGQYDIAEKVSLEVSNDFGPEVFAKSLSELINSIVDKNE